MASPIEKRSSRTGWANDMNPKRIAFRLIIWGIILMAFGVIALTQDHFNMNANGVREVITRQNNPRVYWGACLVPVLLGAAFCAGGVYWMRKPADKINPAPVKRVAWMLIIWGIIVLALEGVGLGYHYLIYQNPNTTVKGVGAVNRSLISLPAAVAACAVGIYLVRKK